MANNVIINLIANPEGLDAGIEKLVELTKVDKTAAEQFNAYTKAFLDRAKKVQATIGPTENLAKATKALNQSIVGGAIAQVAGNIERLNKTIGEGGVSADDFAKSIEAAKDNLRNLDPKSSSFTDLDNAIKKAEDALKAYNKAVDDAKTKTFNLDATFEDVYGDLQPIQTRIGELEDRMYELALAGNKNSEEYKALMERLVEYKKIILEVDNSVDAFAENQSTTFSAAVEGASALTGAFAAVEGAQALLGAESEDFEKTLIKINAAMAILQGLEQIQAALATGSNLQRAISNALTKIAIIQTNLQTAAESKNIVVRYAAIVAQRALNSVMALNPAGIVLIALGTLATTLLLFSKNTETAAEKQERLNAQLDKTNELLDEQIEQNQKLVKTRAGGINDQEDALDNLKAQGVAQSVILAQERKLLQAQLEAERIRKESLRGQKGREDAFQESADRIAEIQNELGANLRDSELAQIEESLKSNAAYADARVAQAVKGSKEELEAQIAAARARQKQALADDSLTAGERAKLAAETERQIRDLRENFQREEMSRRVAIMQADAELELDVAKKLELQRAAVILQAQTDALGKTKDQIVLIEKQKQLQIRQIDEESTRVVLQRRLELYQAASATEKDNAVKDELDKQALIVQAQIDSVGKSAEERLLIERRLQSDITQLTIDADRRRSDLQIAQLKRSNIGQKDEIKKLENQRQEIIIQAQADTANKSKDEVLLIETQKNNAILELDQQIRDILKQRRLQSMDAIVGATLSIAGSLNEIAQNQADFQLSLLEKEQQDRLNALKKQLDNGVLTQEQYNSAQLRIEEEYEKKSKAIKKRIAEQEKSLATFQAVINAATAIVKVFATTGPPLSFVLAATTAAATLAQIAAIQSKPIPAFKTGTNNAPGGLALIGEAGPELFYSGGRWGYAAGPTVLDLPKGSKVIPNLETERILSKYDIPLPKIPSHGEVSRQGERIDYSKIGAAVGRELEKLPLQVFGYDKNGPWQHTTTLQNRNRFISNRFGRSRKR